MLNYIFSRVFTLRLILLGMAITTPIIKFISHNLGVY